MFELFVLAQHRMRQSGTQIDSTICHMLWQTECGSGGV